jgi:hypothetical protein
LKGPFTPSTTSISRWMDRCNRSLAPLVDRRHAAVLAADRPRARLQTPSASGSCFRAALRPARALGAADHAHSDCWVLCLPSRRVPVSYRTLQSTPFAR